MLEMKSIQIENNEYEVVDGKARPVNSVAEMKAMSNLVSGNIIKTIGYYSANDGGGATYLIREKQEIDIEDLGAIHFINDNLVAELINVNNTVNINQFGGKINDSTFDNTPILLNAINYLKTKSGGTIYFNNGVYNFNTSIVIDILQGIIFKGVLSGTNGTVLKYNGAGTFFTINHIKQCDISHMLIQGNELNSQCGFDIGTADRTNFKKIVMKEFVNLMYIKDFGYSDFSDCTFFAYGICQTGVIIGNAYSEFLYFNRCSFDGGINANLSPVLVQLKRGKYVYFNECDFCNTRNYGIRLDVENGELKDVYFDKCTFMHILKGINIGHETNVNHIREIYFLNCLYELDGVEGEGIFTVNNISYSYERNFIVKGLSIKSFNRSVSPEFILKTIGTAPLQDVEFEILRTNLTLEQMKFTYPWNSKIRIKLPENLLRTVGRFIINGNGGTDYTYIISSNSPYAYIVPCILHFSDMNDYKFNYVVSSEINGNIKIKIRFSEVVPEGTKIGFIYKLLTDVAYTVS